MRDRARGLTWSAVVQTTLLGLAIALILALLTALVGPLFVDWNAYRTHFETYAGTLLGAPVRIAGDIDARALPVPALKLGRVEIGTSAQGPLLRADLLDISLELGPLLRGQLHASRVRIAGPQFRAGLDRSGAVTSSGLATLMQAPVMAVDRLSIEGGRAVLFDQASGGEARLEQFTFRGEVRAIGGPIRGEGEFVTSGRPYAYRVALGRIDETTGAKLRVVIERGDEVAAFEADGMLQVERGSPRFDGTFVARHGVPAANALDPKSGETDRIDAFIATGRIAASPDRALIEQVELKLGPSARAVNASGTAEVLFGSVPTLNATLTARQVDIDRLLDGQSQGAATPAVTLTRLAGMLAERLALPLAMRIALSSDAITLGGAVIQSASAEVEADGNGLEIHHLEFRAPGSSRILVSGRLAGASDARRFNGAALVESQYPAALTAWIKGQAGPAAASARPVTLRGDVALGGGVLAVERLRADLDGKPVEGRLRYVQDPGAKAPASLEATLRTSALDVDRMAGLAQSMLSDFSLERPRDVTLAISADKATIGGIEATGLDARLFYDSSRLRVERMAVADLGGASFDAAGEIALDATLRGRFTVKTAGRGMDGLRTVAQSYAPEIAEVFDVLGRTPVPFDLSATIDAREARDAKASRGSTVEFRFDGRAGPYRGDLTLTTAEGVVLSGLGDLSPLLSSPVRARGQIEAANMQEFARWVGLDRLLSNVGGGGRVEFTADGAWRDAMTVGGRFDADDFGVTGKGTMRFGETPVTGTLDVTVASTDPRAAAPAGPPAATKLDARVAVEGDRLSLTGIKGHVAGAAVSGGLEVAVGAPIRMDGALRFATLDLGALLARISGSPGRFGGTAAWSVEPFRRGSIGDLVGRISVAADRASLSPAVTLGALRAVARFEASSLALDEVEGRFGDGVFSGSLVLRDLGEVLGVSGRGKLRSVRLDALWPMAGGHAATGLATIEGEAEGAGRTPAAVIGSLNGSGRFTVETGQLTGMNPQAIEAVITAADRGVPVDMERIGAIATRALDRGTLHAPQFGGEWRLASGRVRFGPVDAPAQFADANLSATLDLATSEVDLRVALAGAPRADAPEGLRPPLDIALKGHAIAPQRQVNVAALVNWLTLRSVERETKRIKELESAQRNTKVAPPVAEGAAATEPTSSVSRPPSSGSRSEPQSAPGSAQGSVSAPLASPPAELPAASAMLPAVPAGDRNATAGETDSDRPPRSERAPELPPPIDVRPPVGSLRHPSAPLPGPRAQANPPPRPAPPLNLLLRPNN